jgi:integron integrase
LAHRQCSASTQNQAFNALLYLYEQVLGEKLQDIRALRAKRSRTHRTALSREITLKLLDGVRDEAGYPTRLIARLLYGCGLRVSEPLNLRVKDVDLAHSRLIIRGAKGGQDRTVMLPCSLATELVTQMKAARAMWERDQTSGLPVEVPGELARKYPRAPFAWQWAWVFPSRVPCDHPRTGERVRYRMHEANVQRAVKKSATALGLDSLATPHVLRHCWATHQLDQGANIRDVQEQLGHKDVETTMLYTHPDTSRLKALL